MPFDLTQSPRAQDMQAQSQGPAPDDEDAIFKDSIGKLAYKTLIKSFPEMAGDVVTFKVLDAEARSGRGIGAFVVKQPQGVIYIPAVVSDNAMKPLDMFYCRRHDAFFPLTPDYLRMTTKGALTDIGTPVERPSSLRSNASIMPYVPGLSGMGGLGNGGAGGRFVYAEAVDPATPFREVATNDGHGSYGPKLAEVMSKASDSVKLAFARCLNDHPRLRARAVEIYGKTKLAEMVAPKDGKEYKQHIGGGAYAVWPTRAAFDRKEKSRIIKEKKAAYAEAPVKKDVFMMTAATPIQQAKKELDPGETAAAFKAVAYHGYYMKDRRKKTDSVFAFAEGTQQYETPSEPGVYTVFLRTGPAMALVIPNPVCVGGCHRALKDDSYASAKETLARVRTAGNFLVIFKDGKSVTVDKLVAEARHAQSTVKEIKKFLGDKLTDAPENNSYGCAIYLGGMTVRATEPCSPWHVASSDGVTTFDACGTTITIDHHRDDARVFATTEPALIRLGGSFKWLRLSRDYDLSSKHFLVSQDEVARFAEYALAKSGAKPVEVKTAGDGYVVGGRGRAVARAEALYKVATEYNISLPYAETALQLAERREPVSLWVKKAEGEGAPVAQSDVGQGPATPAPPPPAPSPVDLAVAEQMQLLQQQAASIQQQMQSLQTVQSRAQQIASGGGAMAAPVGAASMMAGGAQPPMDPSQGQPPMDPSQGQPPMDPSQMAPQGQPQGQPPMDPSQGQPAMDPSQGQEPPMAAMTEEPSPDNIEAQINPQFLGSAAQLNDDNVFDAAAVASIAQQKNLGNLTQAYTPSLEKALDNLGRILLLFYVNESDLKESMGQDAYNDTEEKLRDTFKGLGDVMLNINIEPGQIGSTAAQN